MDDVQIAGEGERERERGRHGELGQPAGRAIHTDAGSGAGMLGPVHGETVENGGGSPKKRGWQRRCSRFGMGWAVVAGGAGWRSGGSAVKR